MNTKQRFLLAASFAAAAVGSVTVVAICLCAIIFLNCRDEEQSLGMEAMALALCEAIVSNVMGILSTLMRIINITQLTSAVSAVTSVCSSIVGIAVFLVGMMAAMELLRGNTPKVPIVGGKFSLKAE